MRADQDALGGGGTHMDIQELQTKAEPGSVVAQAMLGISYLYGHDVPKDYATAFR
jgi:TPR repeat protein